MTTKAWPAQKINQTLGKLCQQAAINATNVAKLIMRFLQGFGNENKRNRPNLLGKTKALTSNFNFHDFWPNYDHVSMSSHKICIFPQPKRFQCFLPLI